MTVDPEGKKLTTTTVYNSATGQVTETRAPAGCGGESAHDTKSIYYTAAAKILKAIRLRESSRMGGAAV